MEESAPPLAPFFDTFHKHVMHADTAVKAMLLADKANEEFRTIGELAAFFDRVESTRDQVYPDLDARRTSRPEAKLPRAWASGFFKHRSKADLTDAEKAVRQAEREASAQAKRDLEEKRKAAKAKVKEAKKELAALEKGR